MVDKKKGVPTHAFFDLVLGGLNLDFLPSEGASIH